VLFSFKNFVPVTVKNRVRVRVSSRVRVRVQGLGIGFREWVPIRNIIDGAAGAQISITSCVTFGLSPTSCELERAQLEHRSCLSFCLCIRTFRSPVFSVL